MSSCFLSHVFHVLFMFALILVTLAPDNCVKAAGGSHNPINMSCTFCPRIPNGALVCLEVIEIEPKAISGQTSFVSPSHPSFCLRWSGVVLCIIVALLTAARLHVFEHFNICVIGHVQDNGRLIGFDWYEMCRGRGKRVGGAHEETERRVVRSSS